MSEKPVFNYPYPEKPERPVRSQAVLDALGKNAMGTNSAEQLLMDKSESPEIKDFKDMIESQAETSLNAANVIINKLIRIRDFNSSFYDIKPATSEEFSGILDAKLDEWQSNGSMDWCSEYLEKNSGTFTLVATPNTLADSKEIIGIAKTFAEDQQPEQELEFFEALYERYSALELSGSTIPDSNIRLSLIPNTLDDRLIGSLEKQRATLQNLQINHPNLRVPSVLDAMAYWESLRAQGDNLINDDTWIATYIRHFDLEGKRTSNGLQDWTLRTYASGKGLGYGDAPGLDYSNNTANDSGRLAVG